MDQMNMYFDIKDSLKILFSIQLLLCQTAVNTEAEFVPPDGGLRVNPKHTIKFNNNSHFRRLI